MIHSLSGGEIKTLDCHNFALVEVIDPFAPNPLKLWYIYHGFDVQVGDRVIVPLGAKNTHKQGKVLRVEKGLVKGRTPIPVSVAKQIISII